jgi:hypothetical protein
MPTWKQNSAAWLRVVVAVALLLPPHTQVLRYLQTCLFAARDDMPSASSAASLTPLVMSYCTRAAAAPSPNAVVFKNTSHFYVASTPIPRTDKAVATLLRKTLYTQHCQVCRAMLCRGTDLYGKNVSDFSRVTSRRSIRGKLFSLQIYKCMASVLVMIYIHE